MPNEKKRPDHGWISGRGVPEHACLQQAGLTGLHLRSVLQFASGFFPTRPRRAAQLLLPYSCLQQALHGTRTRNPSFISNTLSWPTGRYGGQERQDIDHSYSGSTQVVGRKKVKMTAQGPREVGSPRSWGTGARDPVVLAATKGTPEVHEKREVVN